MALRDLREELKKRLQLVVAERGQLEGRILFLRESEQQLKALLDYEEMRVRHEESNLTFPFLSADRSGETARSKFALFIQDALAGGQTRSLEDLKQAAVDARINFEGKRPGRVLHYALLGMSQNGLVERVATGVWRMRGQDK
jgi:hypothetical protein